MLTAQKARVREEMRTEIAQYLIEEGEEPEDWVPWPPIWAKTKKSKIPNRTDPGRRNPDSRGRGPRGNRKQTVKKKWTKTIAITAATALMAIALACAQGTENGETPAPEKQEELQPNQERLALDLTARFPTTSEECAQTRR